MGNIPIDMGVLKSIYANYQSPNMHIALLEKTRESTLATCGNLTPRSSEPV